MLSIILPTLNAQATLAATLDAVLAPDIPGLDVIIVDGGSTDATATIANERGVRWFESAPGRGRQLALGAQHAQSEWLLFLHADTTLPDDWTTVVSRFIVDDANQQRAGYFALAFDDAGGPARRVAGLANWRAKAWSLPYGDQGLLIHRSLYDAVDGFDESLNLMEDVEMARRIGPMRLVRLPATVTTSAAKYRAGGWWARPTKNIACLALYLLGAPQRWVERLYR